MSLYDSFNFFKRNLFIFSLQAIFSWPDSKVQQNGFTAMDGEVISIIYQVYAFLLFKFIVKRNPGYRTFN